MDIGNCYLFTKPNVPLPTPTPMVTLPLATQSPPPMPVSKGACLNPTIVTPTLAPTGLALVISNQGHMLLSKGAYPIISHSTTMLVSKEATLVDPNGVSLPLMDSLPAPFNATHPHCSSCVPKPLACIHESLGLVALFAFPLTCALMAMQSFEHVLSNIDDTINYFHPFSMLAPTTTPATNTYMFS